MFAFTIKEIKYTNRTIKPMEQGTNGRIANHLVAKHHYSNTISGSLTSQIEINKLTEQLPDETKP